MEDSSTSSRSTSAKTEDTLLDSLDFCQGAGNRGDGVCRGRGRPRRRQEHELVAAVHWRVRYAITPVDPAISAQRLN
jgi:hypothetical protein